MRAIVVWLALLSIVALDCEPGTSPGPVPTASAAEVEVFCERFGEVKQQSRQDILVALRDVAPAEIRGPISRAAELEGSAEDDERIDAWFERCGGLPVDE